MFDKFPTPEEFADRTLISPDQAEVVLRYIANKAGTKSGVSLDAARMAAFAINAGMDYRRIAVVFASDYPEFIREADMLGIEIRDTHRPQGDA